MIMDYYILQYVKDPVRGAGKNIAVLAHSAGKAGFRAIGVAPDGSVDISGFAALLGTRKYAWAYREWVDWFIATVECEGRNADTFRSAIERLSAADCCIRPGESGSVELQDGSFDNALNDLFKKNVRLPRIDPFPEYTEKVLNDTGLLLRSDFRRQVEIEFFDGKGNSQATVRVPFILEEKPRTVFMQVWSPGNNRQALLKQVAIADSTFRAMVTHGFVDQSHCVLLTGPLGKNGTVLAPLKSVATIIDVSDSKPAVRKLTSVISSP